MTVICVAPDRERLVALKQAVVAAEWELTAGATDLRGALDQIDVERPHAMVVVGPFEELVAMVAERFPGMRIVADHEMPGVATVAEMADAREALRMQRPPGGPVGVVESQPPQGCHP